MRPVRALSRVTTNPGNVFTRQLKVADNTPISNVKKIQVQVTWNQSGDRAEPGHSLRSRPGTTDPMKQTRLDHAGVSLIELLVVMVILSIVSATLFTLFAAGTQNFSYGTKTAELPDR